MSLHNIKMAPNYTVKNLEFLYGHGKILVNCAKFGQNQTKLILGAIFILRKDIGVGGWSRKWQFSLTLCSENVLT